MSDKLNMEDYTQHKIEKKVDSNIFARTGLSDANQVLQPIYDSAHDFKIEYTPIKRSQKG